jgi:hypothetical protein
VTDSRQKVTGERDPTIGEIADLAMRRVATAIIIAGGAIALAIYARPGPPRYQAFASGAGIVRVDTRSGTVIGCDGGRCMILLQHGQRLSANPNTKSKAITVTIP